MEQVGPGIWLNLLGRMFTAQAATVKNRGVARRPIHSTSICRTTITTPNRRLRPGNGLASAVNGWDCNRGEVVTRDAFSQALRQPGPGDGPAVGRQTTIKDRRIFADFQCAPPKSVFGILAVTMNTTSCIIEGPPGSLHARAPGTGNGSPPPASRKGGIEDKDRLTGNLVGAAFLHSSSRALDPQLGTHFVLFNATWDKTEQRWKALQRPACSTPSIMRH